MFEEGDKRKFKVIDKRINGKAEPEAGIKSGAEEEKKDKAKEKAEESEANNGGIDFSKNGEEIKESKEINGGTESVAAGFEAGFATFIYSLNTQALLFMGKIPNPVTKKYEKELDAAKYLIDIIDMLSKKTKGNLDENEAKLIENILYDLRMAYISEKK